MLLAHGASQASTTCSASSRRLGSVLKQGATSNRRCARKLTRLARPALCIDRISVPRRTTDLPTAMDISAQQPLQQHSHACLELERRWLHQCMTRPYEVVVPGSVSVAPRNLLPMLCQLVPMPQDLPNLVRLSPSIKVGLLQLLVTPSSAEPGAAAALQLKVVDALLEHAREACQKVLAKEEVPAAAKTAAQQRTAATEVETRLLVETWRLDMLQRPDVQQLLPIIAATLAARPATSSTAEAPESPTAAGNGGSAMEAAAVEHMQLMLPPGWQLITNAHVAAVNNQRFLGRRSVKSELDVLLVNAEGVAVAVLEVKLAAANPLVTLVNDMSGLTRAMQALRGNMVTLQIKVGGDLDDLTRRVSLPVFAGGDSLDAAAFASSPGSSFSPGIGSSLVTAAATALETSPPPSPTAALRAKPLITAPFGEPKWATVEVPVAADAQAVYVIGRPMTDNDWNRGVRTLSDVMALQLVCKSAATLAAAFAADKAQPSGSAAPGTATCPADSRIHLQLTPEQQQQLEHELHKRLEVVQQCQVYSLPGYNP